MKRLWRALCYSREGLVVAFRKEDAFRQEVLVLVVLVPLILWLPLSPFTRALLLFTHLLVPLVELLNSAIECVVDLVTGEFHPLAKRAKDYGSAAVFLTLVICAGAWVLAGWEWFGPL